MMIFIQLLRKIKSNLTPTSIGVTTVNDIVYEVSSPVLFVLASLTTAISVRVLGVNELVN